MTQTSKTDLQKRFDRNFPTIERAYNNRRKKDASLPSLMQKDGFVHPIALQIIEKIYAENKQDEVTEPNESNEQLQILEEENERLKGRIADLLNKVSESKTHSIQTSKQLTETESLLSEKVQIVSDLQNRLSEKDTDIQNSQTDRQTDKNIISELYAEKAELQNALSEKDKMTQTLQTELSEKVQTIQNLEKIISDLKEQSKKRFRKYRIPTKLEFINILSNVLAAIGFYRLGGLFAFCIWLLLAMFFWDTILTIKDAKNKKSGEFGFWVTVGIEVLYGFIHPTTITNAIQDTPNLLFEAGHYGIVGSIILTLMSIFSLNQAMNKATDKSASNPTK